MLNNIKNIRYHLLFFLAIILLAPGSAWADNNVRYADLGDFKLENGSSIRDCRVAYRTSGTLNADQSNVVLVSTWLAGTSQELIDIGFIGPGKVFDSSQYYIIAVDFFGNGVSSSPSNSAPQPDKSFPQFNIRDMVRAQHTLLTRHLNIHHVRAVAGISMGALATFQWMVSYPDFMDQAVPISGSPWLTSYEMLFWSAQLGILENVGDCSGSKAAMKVLTPLFIMQAWAPDYRAANTSLASFTSFLTREQDKFSRYDATNWSRQVTAIMDYNILKEFEGSKQKAAATVRTKCMLVTSAQDQIIPNEEAKTFARLIGAKTAVLNGTCGHFAFICDQENLKNIVNSFLGGNLSSSSKSMESGMMTGK